MPASAVQVFGPVTVDPGFTTTGEKTLLTMSTTLPAGGKNIIIATVAFTEPGDYGGGCTIRIKKGATILREHFANRPHAPVWFARHPVITIAIDSSPAGNDSYAVTVNVTAAASSSTTVHVQAIVIKSDDVVYASNSTEVTVANGATGTLVSANTTFPAGTKVVAIGAIGGVRNDGSGGQSTIGAGNVRLKLGTTVVSSNEFVQGSMGYVSGTWFPTWWGLCYFTTLTTSSQTWAIEVYNNSGYSYGFFADLVVFSVSDGAFLDTASVALTNGSQVTVGNLTTTLVGDVAVIGLAAAGNTTGTFYTAAFNANDIVLQKDNSATTQTALLVAQAMDASPYWVRSKTWAMFRFDSGVSSPSYQVKMTARADGINGEAKILAFSLGRALKSVVGETVNIPEVVRYIRGRIRARGEAVNIGEAINRFRSRMRIVGEVININEAIMRVRNRWRLIAEQISIAEGALSLRSLRRTIAEGLNLLEGIKYIRGRIRIWVESVGISEAFLRLRNLRRVLGELISLSEGIGRSRNLIRRVGESINLVEIASRFRSLLRMRGESLNMTETSMTLKGIYRLLSEGVSIVESTLRRLGIVRRWSESISVSESARRLMSLVRGKAESVIVGEGTVVARMLRRIWGETVGVLESLVVSRLMIRRVIESVSLVEAKRSLLGFVRRVDELLGISESINRFRRMVRVATESVRILEVESVRRWLVRVVSEAISLLEIVVVVGIRVAKRLKAGWRRMVLKGGKSVDKLRVGKI